MPALATDLRTAVEKHRAGDHRGAETLCRAILESEPRQPQALHLLGVLCAQTGRAAEAERHLRAAAEAAPNDAAVRYNLGNVLRERGAVDEALSCYEHAIRLAPRHASAHFNLAAVHLEQGRADEAFAQLLRTVEVDPRHARAHHQLGLLSLAGGDPHAASNHWRRALEIEPDEIEYRLNLGLALHRAGRFDEAIAENRAVIRAAPREAAAWCNLGAALRAAGRAREAADALAHCVELDPALAPAHANLAAARLDCGEPAAAREACAAALAHDPRDARHHGLAARAALLMNEPDEAERHLSRAAELSPADAAVRVELGDLRRRIGRPAAALGAYDEALSLDPGRAAAAAGRIGALIDDGAVEPAVEAAGAALDRFPGAPDVVMAAAAAHRAAGDHGAAAVALEEALRRPDLPRPARCRLAFDLGETRDAVYDVEGAFRAFEEANALADAQLDVEAVREQAEAVVRAFRPEVVAALEAARAARAPDEDGPRPIFVTGLPSCGRGAVGRLLASREEVADAGPIALLRTIIDEMPALTGLLTPFPACVEQLGAESIRRMADRAREILAARSGKHPVVLETSPTSFVVLGLAALLLPEARVVACRRDPVDACVAAYFRRFDHGHAYAYDLEHLGFFHRTQERLLAHWSRTLDGSMHLPIHTVRFEDLHDEPERTAREVLEFCGLPPSTPRREDWLPPLTPAALRPAQRYDAFLGPLRDALARWR